MKTLLSIALIVFSVLFVVLAVSIAKDIVDTGAQTIVKGMKR